MDDAAQKRHSRKLRQLETLRKLRRDDFIRAALSTPQGRTYIYWILELCKLDRNPFTANALTTAFACGELNVGQQIRAHIEEIVPDQFLKMLVENKEEFENANGRTELDPDIDDAYRDTESRW